MQRIIGVVLGALVTFAILWLYDTATFSGPIAAYATATIAGAAVSLVWPWFMGWRRDRETKERHEEEIEREVQRQLAEEQKKG